MFLCENLMKTVETIKPREGAKKQRYIRISKIWRCPNRREGKKETIRLIQKTFEK